MASSSGWGFAPEKEAWELRDYSASEGDEKSSGEEDERDDDDDAPEEDPNDSSSDEEMSEHDCSLEFFNMIVALKHQCVLSANQACVLSFWAKGGGLCAPGSRLALHPAQKGGAFSRKFDRVAGITNLLREPVYTMPMVVRQTWTLGRGVVGREVSLVHEKLKDEMGDRPDFWGQVHASQQSQGWKPAFDAHPVVQRHGPNKIIPLGIYIDGVPFNKRDSAIAMWVINLATNRRHVSIVLRKRELCRCGCKGWDTIYTALDCLRWQIAYLAEGKLPECKHDNTPWEGYKGLSPGEDFGWKGVVVLFKADWGEYATTMAFRSWAHYLHPCFLCCCKGGPEGDWQSFEGMSLLGVPFGPKTLEVYNDACRALEKRVTIPSFIVLQDLIGRLEFDKRKQGYEGRALLSDCAALGLRKGDRLEPSELCADTGSIDSRRDFPFDVLFWTWDPNSMCRHRNPIFTHQHM